MNKTLMAAMLLTACVVSPVQGQKKHSALINNVKLSGYGMTQYQYSGAGEKSNTFNIRMVRLSLDGRIAKDFYWKTQVQLNGNTSSLGVSPKMVDVFAEWQKYDFLRIKAGQFKRPFTFENPMAPIDQGFMSYGQVIMKLAGFTDRDGRHSSNGRDIGLQLQGDFLKLRSGRPLLHYQVGVFNGQGINTKDVDPRKDIIGGLWVMPIEGMRIGVFGSEGSYARRGTWTDANGEKQTGLRRLPQHRYAISGEYRRNGWTVRSEYIHSTGKAFAKAYNHADDLKNAEVNEALGSKADGVYALAIAPVYKQKLFAKARYDLYRPTGDATAACTRYEVGANYVITKNIQVNAEYARINDKSLAKHNYDLFDIQVDFKF